MQVARSLIFGIALAASLSLLMLVYLLMKIRRRPAVSGTDSMLGQVAEALEDFEQEGVVFINGERWNAHSEVPVNKGDKVRVTKIHGLIIDIAPTER
jgi:membrane-bound serine protease (ClpP class)